LFFFSYLGLPIRDSLKEGVGVVVLELAEVPALESVPALAWVTPAAGRQTE